MVGQLSRAGLLERVEDDDDRLLASTVELIDRP
jgi:hypothetical protein